MIHSKAYIRLLIQSQALPEPCVYCEYLDEYLWSCDNPMEENSWCPFCEPELHEQYSHLLFDLKS